MPNGGHPTRKAGVQVTGERRASLKPRDRVSRRRIHDAALRSIHVHRHVPLTQASANDQAVGPLSTFRCRRAYFPLLIRGGTSGKGAAWCPVRGGAWDEPDLVGGWDGTSSIGGSHNPAAQCA
ncbi:hypothetical protein ACCO45_003035 [Purpureocillium lilacinum]|uniref:Uncharacterized protein n=1 Tax=Purpureocillium lilacinum TaxID=33203 RepID=A0ACC4DZM1_PURLI